MWITCWWLNLSLNNHSRIRRDCAASFRCCRLLVVLIEGRDLCPVKTRRSVSETCEIDNKVVWLRLWDCLYAVMAEGGLELLSKFTRGYRPCRRTPRIGKAPVRVRVLWRFVLECAIWIVVTWLILPVVICLSQRLSHACLSINKFVLWNCEWLIKSVIVYLMVSCYMDNCGNSRANTCNQAPTSGRGVFIR